MNIVIPARFASTRLPGKPLLKIGGKPMIQLVYEKALQSRAREVVIATDDERIARAADSFSAQVCMTSPDHASGTDRIAEVIAEMGWSDHEIVVNLQGDEPLMPLALIDQVADDLANHPDADTATLCALLERPDQAFDPNVVKVAMDKKGYALYFSRAPIPWQRGSMAWGLELAAETLHGLRRHIGLYAYRAGFVREFVSWPPAPIEVAESLEQLRTLWHGRRIHVSLASEVPPTGVDTQEDLHRVDALFRQATGQ